MIRPAILSIVLAALAALAAAPAPDVDVRVLPKPRSVEGRSGVFTLAGPVRIVVGDRDAVLRDAAEFLRTFLEEHAGLRAAILRGSDAPAIVFERAEPGEDGMAGSEAYSLEVSTAGVRIRASGAPGATWAVQTLRQLLPPEIEQREARASWEIPAVRITDSPRFGWRGCLLDAGRHFFPPAAVKRFIDLLALHKLNVLHWHLTEDQGWRLEIRKYPRLTSVGAWRIEADGTRYGGFYTQAEVRDIVEYARARAVTIVPEIEMPGHATAALVAYPQFSCTGESTAVPVTWGVFEDVYCPGREATFRFLEDVLDEVMALFPSRVIHIGGDEVPKAHWKACPLCQQRMKAEGLKDEGELQSYFIRRIADYARSKGREIAGWDEILEGGLPEGATVQAWRDADHGRTAASLGHRVISSVSSHAYINRSPAELPLARVFEFDPVPDGLAADKGDRITGGEATLWSEGINEANLDAMAFPRLAAMAEALWTGGPRSFPEFKARLDAAHYPRLRALGVTVGPEDRPLVSLVPAFDPATTAVSVRVEHHVEPFALRYTTDGTAPTTRSPFYADGQGFAADGTVRVQPFLGGAPMLQSATFAIERHLAVGRPVRLAVANSPKYPGTGPFTLTDSLRGSTDLRDGLWQGWEGEDMDAVIDLGGSTGLSEIEVGAMQAVRSWILMPARVEFLLSDDDATWRAAGVLTNDVPARQEGTIIRRFRQTLPAGSRARFVRVRAVNAGPLPAWHPGAGGKAWVFVDEVAVR